MKKTILILLIASQMAAQNDTIKHRKFENVDYKMIGIIGAVTFPSVILYSMDAKSDKLGQVTFGSMSVISITALSTSLALYLNSTDSKKPFIHYSCMAIAGSLDGISEELKFHYPKVKSKMPFLNDRFWNPAISSNRKYKNGDPNQGAAYFGSRDILVATTDGYHASRGGSKGFVIGGIITFDYKKSLKQNLKQIGLTALVYTGSKGLTHFLINN